VRPGQDADARLPQRELCGAPIGGVTYKVFEVFHG